MTFVLFSGDRSPSNPPANNSFPSLQNVAADIEDLDHASNTSHLGGGTFCQVADVVRQVNVFLLILDNILP